MTDVAKGHTNDRRQHKRANTVMTPDENRYLDQRFVPPLHSCNVAVQRKQRKCQPSRGKEYKNVYNWSLSGYIWHVQAVKDKDLQSNLSHRQNKQK